LVNLIRSNPCIAHDPLSLPTSVHPRETNVDLAPLLAHPYPRVHASHRDIRESIISTLARSNDPQLQRRAGKLANCCRHPDARQYPDGTVKVHLFSCRDRVCPLCARTIARRTSERVGEVIQGWDEIRHLTLTLQSTDEPLSEQIDHLLRSFRRMRQSRWWSDRVRGGIGTVEITHNSGTGRWHPHLHVLLDGTYLPQADLADVWLRSTGDSQICYITMPPSRSNAAKYIAKYVTKPSDIAHLPANALLELISALSGRRTLITFGSAHNSGLPVKLPPDDRPGSTHLCPIYAAKRAFVAQKPFAIRLVGLLRTALPVAYKLVSGDYDPPPVEASETSEADWAEISKCFSDCDWWHFQGTEPPFSKNKPPNTSPSPSDMLFDISPSPFT